MTEVIDESTDLHHQHGKPEGEEPEQHGVTRRNVLRAGAVSIAAVGLGAGKVLMQPSLQARGFLNPNGLLSAASQAVADSLYIEAFPISPLILNPFNDPLLIPKALKPLSPAEVAALNPPPGPGVGQQNSFGNETHQLWTDAIGFPDPIVYDIKLQVAQHSFTSSQVLPINALGQPTQSFDADGNAVPAGTVRSLPPTTIYAFNGIFPGPMINAEYGKACLVRFSNHLDENPLNLERQDFGDPELRFLTHLHNAHTAAESDGNPHYSFLFGPKDHGFPVGSFVDQLYLNWPAGNDDREKQSFFWFHDHVMDFTGGQRLPGNGRPLSRSTTRRTTWTRATRPRACACPACGPITRTAPSTSSTTSRWRSSTSGSTTASRSTRTSTTGWASSRPPATPARTPSGGASRSSSTSPTTASSATSSPSTAPRSRCSRSSGASTGSGSSTARSPASTSSS